MNTNIEQDEYRDLDEDTPEETLSSAALAEAEKRYHIIAGYQRRVIDNERNMRPRRNPLSAQGMKGEDDGTTRL